MGTSLREEMISLSLFGGRLALAKLILFSSALMLAGRHDVQGMAAIDLIFE